MKLAIIGTKNPVDYSTLKLAVEKFGLKPKEVVSTGEKGVSELAKMYSKYNSIKHTEIKADWKSLDAPNAVIKEGVYGQYNSRAGIDRDNKIVSYVDAVLIVEPDGDKNFIESNVKKSTKKLYIYNGENDSDEVVNF